MVTRADDKLFVSPGVDLLLALEDVPTEPDRLRECEVVGPDLARGCVFRHCDEDDAEGKVGRLSPFHEITLPPEVRAVAGIPLEATQFCFLYPFRALAENMPELIRVNAASEHTWLDALLFGAFCYFDNDERLISINALSLTVKPHWLYLDGPHDCHHEAQAALEFVAHRNVVCIKPYCSGTPHSTMDAVHTAQHASQDARRCRPSCTMRCALAGALLGRGTCSGARETTTRPLPSDRVTSKFTYS